MRILVVDDNPEALKVIESFLKALDHQVSSYTDAREALLWLGDCRPQIIIADLEMPEMDGFQFLKQLQARASYATVPVICITGTEITDEEIMVHGFTSVLRKPTTLSDLAEAVEDVTEAIRARA